MTVPMIQERGDAPSASTLFPASFVIALLLSAPPLTGGHAQDADPTSEATGPQLIQVEAEDYAFDAPEEISSGWTTLRYVNTGEEPHLLLVARLPEGKTVEDYQAETVPVFDEAWHQLREGRIDQEEALRTIQANLPEWYGGIVFKGGSGIVREGGTAEVTLHLEPGTYLLECYMKNEEDEFHGVEGMIRELAVIDEDGTDYTPPEADVEITLSNFAMDISGDLTAGERTFAVHVEEHPEEGFGHNVHVARDLEEGPDEVMRWMNYLALDGLRPPAPATFIGGIHLMPAGETGYFTVDLEPGRHLFLSEFTGHRGVRQEVEVEP